MLLINPFAGLEKTPSHELKQRYFIFNMLQHKPLVKLGSFLLEIAVKINFPFARWAVEKTLFQEFCGGKDLQGCLKKKQKLSQLKINVALDFGVEGNTRSFEFLRNFEEIKSSVDFCDQHGIRFLVIKPTSLTTKEILTKKSKNKAFSIDELTLWNDFIKYIAELTELCSHKPELTLLVDAEESWFQPAVDEVVLDLMLKYNKPRAIIYQTFQMYLSTTPERLKTFLQACKKQNVVLGAKLVRGAYLEKEIETARLNHTNSPIQASKTLTDKAFDDGCRLCLDNLDSTELFVGTHNESSCIKVAEGLKKKSQPNNPKVFFSQLLGMSDHLSISLAQAGFNVCKYMPYGPVNITLPYLLRRAEENSSMQGQMGRELKIMRDFLSLPTP